MMLRPNGVTFLAAPTLRAAAYCEAIRRSGLNISRAVILSKGPDALRLSRAIEALGANVPVSLVDELNLNAPAVLEALGSTVGELIIVAPPPGNILSRSLLGSGGWFLHIHPGELPGLRGSTTLHYAALLGDEVEVTALILDEGVDTGPVVLSRRHRLPADRHELDGSFDTNVRASVLSDVLTELRNLGRLEATPQHDGPPALHVIHPVLRHIAVTRRNELASSIRIDDAGEHAQWHGAGLTSLPDAR